MADVAGYLVEEVQHTMKKVILIIVGSLAGLYALGAISQFIWVLVTHDAGTAFGTMNIAASAVPVCLGLIVGLACFTSAFRKSNP